MMKSMVHNKGDIEAAVLIQRNVESYRGATIVHRVLKNQPCLSEPELGAQMKKKLV